MDRRITSGFPIAHSLCVCCGAPTASRGRLRKRLLRPGHLFNALVWKKKCKKIDLINRPKFERGGIKEKTRTMPYLAQTVGVFVTGSCLMARLGDSRHIPACCALLEQFRFVFDDPVWNTLPRLFSCLLRLGAMQLCLVEDRGVRGAPSIVAFCGSIFMADAFCLEARTKLPPYWDRTSRDDFKRGGFPRWIAIRSLVLIQQREST